MKIVSLAAIAILALLGAGARSPISAQLDGGQELTDDTLRSMLKGLGFEPEALDGGFAVSISRDGWVDTMLLTLSPDRTKIGINSNLGVVDKPDVIS
ncbi:MAG: hypothetical protein ACHQ50_00945, partial [Fimbriimonadales bacterium]